ncbi:heterokaryon incompatibility protein-domain-containing protein [Pyrenochaeta sp. MPI-SDFR-AT-0127]|nr:heterokaryon incompatibility protein-domain-containing protein [Pyrenochaeta sp. MPI-SDFR-AT-0127]
MDDPYQSAPLSIGEFWKQEFRLVELLPKDNESGELQCRLRLYSLNNDHPAFVALSYAWGQKGRYTDIQLNGVRFPVGYNLWSFLNQMDTSNHYGLYWIDAICIDQSNVLEQNHQVQMMRQIYSSAHSVSVWLGDADDASFSNIAMQHLAARKRLAADHDSFAKFWSPRQAKGVLTLCERPYWRRIWIVQELMLAKDANIYCGSEHVNWTCFMDLVQDLQKLSDRGREKHTPCASSILASPAIIIANAKSKWGNNLQPLTVLLELYGTQEATNIHDKVYALHGLASDSGLIIDYRISIKDLLVEVLYHACQARGTKADIQRGKRELIRFGKFVSDVLKVHCPEEEIAFHISMAEKRPPTVRNPRQVDGPYGYQTAISSMNAYLATFPGLRERADEI